jgi:integrase
LDDYLDFLRERKSKKTVQTYKRGAVRLCRFLEAQGINGSLEDQPHGLMDQFVSWLLAEDPKPAPATVHLYVSGARSYLDWRRRMGEAIPIFASPHMPKVRPKEHFALNDEQLREYLECALERPDPARTILLLLPFCGLRSEEMLILRMDSFYATGNAIVFKVLGKGDKRRDVPLLIQGNGVLRAYMKGWRSQFPKSTPWAFPGHRSGEHLHIRTLRHHMVEVRKAMNPLPGHLAAHVLRKTYAMTLERAGLSPFVVAQLLGHASPRTPHETYVHHEVGTLISDLEQVNLPAPQKEA